MADKGFYLSSFLEADRTLQQEEGMEKTPIIPIHWPLPLLVSGSSSKATLEMARDKPTKEDGSEGLRMQQPLLGEVKPAPLALV